MTKKYYKILEIPDNSSKSEIHSAYIRLAKRYHPDVGGDIEKFLIMQKAYNNIIKNPAKITADEDKQMEVAAAHSLYKRKMYTRSGAILRNYLLNNKNDIAANLLYAKIMKEFGKLHDAEEHLKKVIDEEPFNINALLELASIYKNIGLTGRATAVLQKAVKWDKNNKKALKMLEELNERQTISLKTLFRNKRKA